MNPLRSTLALAAISAALSLTSCTSEPAKGGTPQGKQAGPKGKQIAWRDLAYNNDTIKVNTPTTWNYVFYNTGHEPVRIKQAMPSNMDCTCTWPKNPVPVGEQDTVKLHCNFKRAMREAVNIDVEHDTPQHMPVLVLITHVVD